jgi:hypothetical protein
VIEKRAFRSHLLRSRRVGPKQMARWHNLAQTHPATSKPLSDQSHALSAVPNCGHRLTQWLCHKGWSAGTLWHTARRT